MRGRIPGNSFSHGEPGNAGISRRFRAATDGEGGGNRRLVAGSGLVSCSRRREEADGPGWRTLRLVTSAATWAARFSNSPD